MYPPVAKAATHVPFQATVRGPTVRGAAGSKRSQRTTVAVILEVSTYLGAAAPVAPADAGRVARLRSLGCVRSAEKPLGISHRECHERMYWRTKVSISENGKKSPVSLP